MLLDVTQGVIVIVGGGAVAVRKARGLIEAGAAKIHVVAPEIHRDMPGEVQRIEERFEARHIVGARLVFAATDSVEVNSAVVDECRARGVLVNRADSAEGELGDFTTPAMARKGPILIAVSASGAPAIALELRDFLVEQVTAKWVEMAEAMRILRPRVLKSGLSPTERREVFRELATGGAMEKLSESGIEGVWKWLAEKNPALAGLRRE
jgi:precorrin-2 dehydrogenase/sirohydrochlorin ferrochelatase